ncbi:uncharacterized protein EV154DRAFT_568562 [Mucor mucedo]|uniref:uncharacterized protein n=1 Tax=Mucor mucedo TaxID=29922 RepID=UPI002220574E|nr:uncharacterized protein EV154DRAFT_568562 [Mucor mucedo]KAI7880024.1 hypothetical protein EV154DRAFT_568562 [Mucor mucedo]
MDSQLQQVESNAPVINRASRLCIECEHNGSPIARKEVERSSTQHTASIEQSHGIVSYNSQFDYEDRSSHICTCTSSSVRSAFDENEEPECELMERLAQDTGNTKGMHRGVTLVEKQSTSTEWETYTSTNTTADHIRRCQQHGLVMQHETKTLAEQNRIRTLDVPGSQYVNQLVGVESGVSCFKNISATEQHEDSDMNRQYNIGGQMNKQEGVVCEL